MKARSKRSGFFLFTVDPLSVAAVARTFSDLTDGQALKRRDLVLMLLECSPAPFSRDHCTPRSHRLHRLGAGSGWRARLAGSPSPPGSPAASRRPRGRGPVG